MDNVTRRSMLQGTLVLGTGLLFPWGFGRATPRLTGADHALLSVIRHRRAGGPFKGKLSRVRVHRLFREHMSLDWIDDIRVEVIDEVPNENGYITYYKVDWGTSRSRPAIASSGCFLRPGQMDEWVRRNHAEEAWVPLNFAGRT